MNMMSAVAVVPTIARVAPAKAGGSTAAWNEALSAYERELQAYQDVAAEYGSLPHLRGAFPDRHREFSAKGILGMVPGETCEDLIFKAELRIVTRDYKGRTGSSPSELGEIRKPLRGGRRRLSRVARARQWSAGERL